MIRSIMQSLHRPVYESRLRELVRVIVPHLTQGDSVLDVACGFGALSKAIVNSSSCPSDVSVRGLERQCRGQNLIEVDSYSGEEFPYERDSFDVVILADVLHHESNPYGLIEECIRVTRRLLIIKDHKPDGFLAQWRISLLDWAANAPYGVQCLYRYHTLHEWKRLRQQFKLQVEVELVSMKLYPPLINRFFGRRLQYFVVLRVTEPD